jgi:hypothetical protein
MQVEPAKLKVSQKSDEQAASGIGSEVGGKYRYAVTTTDVAEFDPDEFQLLVSLKNLGKAPMAYDNGLQVEYLINGKPVSFSQSHEGVSIASVPAGGTAFIRLTGPRIETLKDGDQAVVTLHNLQVKSIPGHADKPERADVTWQLAVKPERTVELKTVTKTEWR